MKINNFRFVIFTNVSTVMQKQFIKFKFFLREREREKDIESTLDERFNCIRVVESEETFLRSIT